VKPILIFKSRTILVLSYAFFWTAIITVLLLPLIAGCNDWERGTFQALAASQAVIGQAHTDYTARTIPQTHCANAFISNAVTADSAAVQAFKAKRKQGFSDA